MRVGYNPAGVNIKSDARERLDMAFLAHFQVAPADAVAADDDGVLAATNLGADAQEITTGISNPAVPRGMQVVGNVSGVVGNVKIDGTNYAGDAITETLALNEVTPKLGTKAFKTITKITLPVQVHTPRKQVETATAAGTVTTTGNAAVTVTSKLFAAPIAVAVPVVEDDDADAIALAIRTALAAEDDITAHFDVSGATSAVILTAKVPAANDETLNIAIANGTGEGASVGVTPAATSANTTSGVPYDTVKVGFTDVLGLPYKLSHNTVIPGMTYLNNTVESNAPEVKTSATNLESNTIDLHTALNGTVVDAYLIV